jgi:hypothetical protein
MLTAEFLSKHISLALEAYEALLGRSSTGDSFDWRCNMIA